MSRKRSHSPEPYINETYYEYDSSYHRSGKWTPEEEQFAQSLIHDFEHGLLDDCEDGCTLRAYLARRLNCAPMRISKKFAGQCIGKHVFSRRVSNERKLSVLSSFEAASPPSYKYYKKSNKEELYYHYSSPSSGSDDEVEGLPYSHYDYSYSPNPAKSRRLVVDTSVAAVLGIDSSHSSPTASEDSITTDYHYGYGLSPYSVDSGSDFDEYNNDFSLLGYDEAADWKDVLNFYSLEFLDRSNESSSIENQSSLQQSENHANTV